MISSTIVNSCSMNADNAMTTSIDINSRCQTDMTS